MASEERINEVYNQSLKMIEDEHLNTGDYMSMVVKVMQLVEYYSDIDGSGKSDLGVGVVMKLVEHFSNEEPMMATILTETTVRNLMAVSVNIFKGKYKLGKKLTGFKSMFAKCCGQ